MNIKTFCMGVCATNCYIADDGCGNCAVFDPCDMGDSVYRYTKLQNLKICAVIITHAHFDHIFGLTDLINAAKADGLDIPVYIHELDAAAMSDVSANLSGTLFKSPYSYNGKLKTLKDGDTVTVGKLCFKVMHTPGHTPGSSCFAEEHERVIFTGDTLFDGSCGRTDFDGGSPSDMKNSLSSLAALCENYEIYPGHGQKTELDEQRAHNPYMP